MPRVVTFGRQPTSPPPGTLREIHWPQLARLDSGTKEGFVSRVLSSDGGDSRGLPRTAYFQLGQAPGHFDAFAFATVYEVTIDGEAGIMSGKGWVSDTDQGRLAAAHIIAKSLFHNSIDLTDIGPNDVEIIEHGDFWDDDWYVEIRFNGWAFGATTSVGKPAFADAHSVFPDEIMAALEDTSPLVVDCPGIFTAHTATEIVAGMAKLPSWDHFHVPEADIPHKIMVDEPDADGWCRVYGHLGKWGVPHTGYDGQQIYIPRSRNDYARFCQPSVLTDRGMVRTGPIVLYGGHGPLNSAADDPKNAWADVRVVDGKHGPWVCGIARPHISHEDAERYVARASRLSGHWKGGELRMIISCNAEGYPVDYQPEEGELVASFGDFEQRRGVTLTDLPSEILSFRELSQETQQAIRMAFSSTTGTANREANEPAAESFDATLERERLLIELDLEDEAV